MLPILSAAKQCLLFKTDQGQDVKKMEKMNSLFFVLMTKGADATLEGEAK
jgi:signal recognition particle subunit SRP9